MQQVQAYSGPHQFQFQAYVPKDPNAAGQVNMMQRSTDMQMAKKYFKYGISEIDFNNIQGLLNWLYQA